MSLWPPHPLPGGSRAGAGRPVPAPPTAGHRRRAARAGPPRTPTPSNSGPLRYDILAPTSATEENAPDQRGSLSSGLEDRTMTRPPSRVAAARSSAARPSSSRYPSTARRAAAGRPRRIAPAPALSAGLASATGTTQPGSTASPAAAARASRAALAPASPAAAASPGPSQARARAPAGASFVKRRVGPAAGDLVAEREQARHRPGPHPAMMISSEAYEDSSSCPSSVTSSISSRRTPNSCTLPCWVSRANTMPGLISSG